MNFDELDLNLLKVFQAIYAERQLTRAGERLGLAQPTVSNALSRLRQALDDPLFIRTAQGMQPTPLAEALADQVLEGLGLLKAGLEQSLHFDPAQTRRRFRVAMSDYTGAVLLPALVVRLQAEAPNADLAIHHLRRDEAQEALKAGRLDLVITDELDGPGLYRQAIYSERFVSLVRADHPLSGESLSLPQYLAVGHLLFSLDGHGGGIVDSLLGAQGLRRRVAVRVPHVSVIPRIIAQTDLIVTLPERVALQFRDAWRLRVLQPPLEIPRYSVRQFWHEKYHRDPANRWLRQLLAKLGEAQPEAHSPVQ